MLDKQSTSNDTKSGIVLGIIPSRYGSSRLPGKPLKMIGSKPMIQWVYENCKKSLDHVYVATDDERIKSAVEKFGGKAVMTSSDHQSGTDRCAEALSKVEKELSDKVDVVINIQGDEPFFDPQQIKDIKSAFEGENNTQIATLIKNAHSIEQINDIGKAKVVLNKQNEAILFSRSPIPFVRNYPQEEWLEKHNFYIHMGIYAYSSASLREIVKLPCSILEKAESLEQLRWIENGYKVKCVLTENDSAICVDTPDDLTKANDLANELEKQ